MTTTGLQALAATAVQRAAALATTPGVTGSVGVVVTGGPDGEDRVGFGVVDGRPLEVTDTLDLDCTFTLSADDGRSMVRGTLRPSVAFMRGRLKTAGNNGLVLGVLQVTAEAAFAPWLTTLAEGAGAP